MKLKFLEDKRVDGELVYEKGKVYDITEEKGRAARWIKRGCQVVTEGNALPDPYGVAKVVLSKKELRKLEDKKLAEDKRLEDAKKVEARKVEAKRLADKKLEDSKLTL